MQEFISFLLCERFDLSFQRAVVFPPLAMEHTLLISLLQRFRVLRQTSPFGTRHPVTGTKVMGLYLYFLTYICMCTINNIRVILTT